MKTPPPQPSQQEPWEKQPRSVYTTESMENELKEKLYGQPSQPAEVPNQYEEFLGAVRLASSFLHQIYRDTLRSSTQSVEISGAILGTMSHRLDNALANAPESLPSPPAPVAEGEVKAAIEYLRDEKSGNIETMLLCTEVERLTAENIQLSEIREETVLVCEQLNSENSDLTASLSCSQQESLELAAWVVDATRLFKQSGSTDYDEILSKSPPTALAEHNANLKREICRELAVVFTGLLSPKAKYAGYNSGVQRCIDDLQHRSRQPQTQQEGK